LAVGDGVSNVAHKFRHKFDIPAVPHASHVLESIGYVLELLFDPSQGTGVNVKSWIEG
jgi:hypothetical protein